MALRDALVTAGFRGGWAAVRALEEGPALRLVDRAAEVVHRRGGAGVDRMRSNYATVRPDLSDAAVEDLVAEGVRGYLRYWWSVFRLPALAPSTLAASVRLVGDGPARAHLAAGRSVVLFLGHMGDWDLAGAWSQRHFAPVVTVAERLRPEEVFDEFVRFRTGLGMTILPLTGGPPVVPALQGHITDLRGGPFLVPLLSDRDLRRTGVEVDLCGSPARVATGPTVLAASTGAALFPLSIRQASRADGGYGIECIFHDEVVVPRAEGAGRPDPDVIRAATQACIAALGTTIAAEPHQWHMMQPVFTVDLDPARSR